MGTGMIICGLNGTGKSTLGKALAERLHFHFIDNEDLYFPKTDSDYAAVKGDYGESVSSFFQYAVLIAVPRDIRLKRVRNRSFQKFGNRMLPGGDLYEREERFFDLVQSRAEDTVEKWVQSLRCPIIRIDGTKPIEENVNFIVQQIHSETKTIPKRPGMNKAIEK